MTGSFPDPVTIDLPRGEQPSFALVKKDLAPDAATAAVIKDAGDDPDVTHGALIVAKVARARPGSGVVFSAGEGVGMVTRRGLAVAVGEPAINPGPRQMIREAIAAVAERHGTPGDVEVVLSIPGGEELAAQTSNGRLGIKGGLSILGTTGIVIPYSCSSWIHSIHRGIDVARAAGIKHMAGATGRTSEAAVQRMYGLPEMALLEMGDFAGALLKYLRRHPVRRLSMAGGFAKISKLAAGHLDLHSKRARVDVAELADLMAALGASPTVVTKARQAHSAGEVLMLDREAGLRLPDLIARRAREVSLATLSGETDVEVLIFDREGRLLGRASV